MSNLYSGEVITNGEYTKLSELTELTFDEGTKYVIQFDMHGGRKSNDFAYVREGEIGKGFKVFNCQPFQYTAGTDDLYVKTVAGCSIFVNIAD